jgi:hypothetical protein
MTLYARMQVEGIATRGTISDALKQWAAGDKRACPNLKN